MKVQDLRQLGVEELKGKIRQWRDDSFKNRFAAHSAEKKDTSILRKTRRNIARGLTILAEKQRTQEIPSNG